MTRDEWNQVLATEPATNTQVGAIIGEFDRLGVAGRAERLAISAELLGLADLSSTTDLVMGDAGRLVAMLRRTRDRAGLPDLAAAAVDDGQGGEHGGDDGQGANERTAWPEVIARITAMFYPAAASRQNLAGKFPDCARGRAG
jgi:hypothetical protein